MNPEQQEQPRIPEQQAERPAAGRSFENPEDLVVQRWQEGVAKREQEGTPHEQAEAEAFQETIDHIKKDAVAVAETEIGKVTGDKDLVAAIVGEQAPAIQDLDVIAAHVRESGDTLMVDLDALLANPDAFEEVTELSEDDIEVLGEADDAGLAHIEEGTYAPEVDAQLQAAPKPIAQRKPAPARAVPPPIPAPALENATHPDISRQADDTPTPTPKKETAPDIPQPADTVEEPEAPEETEQSKLDARFHELLPNVPLDFNAAEMHTAEKRAFYENLKPAVAADLKSIVETYGGESPPFLFFTRAERTGPGGVGKGYYRLNLEDPDWREKLQTHLEQLAQRQREQEEGEAQATQTMEYVRQWMNAANGEVQREIPLREAQAALPYITDRNDKWLLKDYIVEKDKLDRYRDEKNREAAA